MLFLNGFGGKCGCQWDTKAFPARGREGKSRKTGDTSHFWAWSWGSFNKYVGWRNFPEFLAKKGRFPSEMAIWGVFSRTTSVTFVLKYQSQCPMCKKSLFRGARSPFSRLFLNSASSHRPKRQFFRIFLQKSRFFGQVYYGNSGMFWKNDLFFSSAKKFQTPKTRKITSQFPCSFYPKIPKKPFFAKVCTFFFSGVFGQKYYWDSGI